MNRTSRIFLITAISFGSYYIVDSLFFSEFRELIDHGVQQIGISHNIAYLIFGIPIFIGVFLIHRTKIFSSLGLNRSLKKGFLFSLICTAPMLIGYAIVFKFNMEISLNTILISGIAAAFFEELYFRGFLFGQLFRFTKLGFIPAILVGAIIFAAAHVYQSQDAMTLLGVFLTTFLGAILFAWVYAEWNNNLWVPIFLHFFMNLFWMLFSAGDNALGGLYSNIFRILTIVLVIILTITYKRRKGLNFAVNKNTVWAKISKKSQRHK